MGELDRGDEFAAKDHADERSIERTDDARKRRDVVGEETRRAGVGVEPRAHVWIVHARPSAGGGA